MQKTVERDPGNSGTVSPVHLQLLVPATNRGLCVLCVRTVTKSVVVRLKTITENCTWQCGHR